MLALEGNKTLNNFISYLENVKSNMKGAPKFRIEKTLKALILHHFNMKFRNISWDTKVDVSEIRLYLLKKFNLA